MQILQKATKGTKDQGGNHGSLLPLLPFVRNPVFERLDLKTGKEPQMHTDSHGYGRSSGRMGRYRNVRTVGCLSPFIRVHLRSSVVKIRGLGLVAVPPRQKNRFNPRFQSRLSG
jgi:hypothetical protein